MARKKRATPKPVLPGSKTKPARILLVDDHRVVRDGLGRLLDQSDDLFTCGQAETIVQALDLIPKTNPNLAIVDLTLGNENGMDLIHEISRRHPSVPVLVLSMHEASQLAPACLRAGAAAYVMKSEPTATLLKTIRQVLADNVCPGGALARSSRPNSVCPCPATTAARVLIKLHE